MTAAERLRMAAGAGCVRSDRWHVSVGAGDRGPQPAGYHVSYRPDDPYSTPAGCGLRGELNRRGTGWRILPDTTTMRADQAEFWASLSDHPGPGADPFGGLTVPIGVLMDVLPDTARGAVLEGLRLRAAHDERRIFELSRNAKALRAAVARYGGGWVCPHTDERGGYTCDDSSLRVVRVTGSGDPLVPNGAWQVLGRPHGLRERPLPTYLSWWATRRAADDEARRLLDSSAP